MQIFDSIMQLSLRKGYSVLYIKYLLQIKSYKQGHQYSDNPTELLQFFLRLRKQRLLSGCVTIASHRELGRGFATYG